MKLPHSGSGVRVRSDSRMVVHPLALARGLSWPILKKDVEEPNDVDDEGQGDNA
jgi:hypothetical protein